LAISLSAQPGTLPLDILHVAQAMECSAPGGFGVHSLGHELARAHREVKLDFLVDFLLDRHAPQPRAKGALHVPNSTFVTPAEKRFHVAISIKS
jgi:hypothetical protein